MKIGVFWDIAPYSLGVDQHFRGAYCLHHQGDRPGDGVSMHLSNMGVLVQDYTMLYSRRLSYLYICMCFHYFR
jgi:hypothetical protein